MGWSTRREFLRGCAEALPLLGMDSKLRALQTGAGQKLRLSRFVDPLPRLRVLVPEAKKKRVSYYKVRMVEFAAKLHSELPAARLWGYDGQYPGPLFEARAGEPVEVEWVNALPARHLFAVDKSLHGAMGAVPEVRVVPHLHGGRTDSLSDGLPEKWFAPGHSVVYRYPNEQRAAGLWYHDHALGITRLNAYAGLSGMYLLRDAAEEGMGLPSGEYEVPLVLQDRTLDAGGQLVYQARDDMGQPVGAGRWGPHMFGELAVINGAVHPYLEVEPGLYRLRLLNAANARFFHLFLNMAKRPSDVPSLVGFYQIGSDGGLLDAPVELHKLLLAPGERADLIVDFSSCAGRTVTLSNDAAAPYPGWTMLGSPFAPLPELMQFRVSRPKPAGVREFKLPPVVAPAEAEAEKPVRMRDFVLAERFDAEGKSMGMWIDGKGYDEPVTERVELNSVEVWRFINHSDDAHPVHLHLVQFRIVSRQGFDTAAFAGGQLRPAGGVRLPAANEAGWKDTAVVSPGEMLSIRVKFEGYPGRYVFHCHTLEHEDNDMMRPFEVVSAG